MHTTLTMLIDRLDSSAVAGTDVIGWGCPVPSFGDLSRSRIATVGLNPSNREFVDESGNELKGTARRFHTLCSLGLSSWEDVDARHLQLILDSCQMYFSRNPYNGWFRKLDRVIAGTNASYYDAFLTACHVDLIPYATARKWADLTTEQRSTLMAVAGDALALLLRDSPVQMLILNGRSVVDQFQAIAGVNLERHVMEEWSLRRDSTPDVVGVAYTGVVDSISDISLGHSITVLGFNHNLQSSFGVTSEVMNAIRDWIGRVSHGVIQ